MSELQVTEVEFGGLCPRAVVGLAECESPYEAADLLVVSSPTDTLSDRDTSPRPPLPRRAPRHAAERPRGRGGSDLTAQNSDPGLSFPEVVSTVRELPGPRGLCVSEVGLAIDGQQLLENVSFNAGPGSLTAVIGPSGSGKSTLGRLLSGEARPTGGSVSLAEADVHRDYSALCKRIAMVPQEDVVHHQLTVGEALRFGAELRLPRTSKEERGRAVERVLRELEIEDRIHRRIDTLSGGQRKRVSVALELLTEPELLVLDEPTSGLDPALDRQVMLMLRRLADAGRIVVVITHTLTYLHVCDQVLMLAPGGRPAFCGTPASIEAEAGSSDWADIYSTVGAEPDAFQKPLPTGSGEVAAPGCIRHEVASHRRHWSTLLEQFQTIAHRQVRLILADRGYLSFLAIMPVVLGLLSLAVAGDAGMGATASHDRTPNEATQILSLMCIGAIFVGTSLSLRDLFGERMIFRREQAIGLSASCYLLAKLTVFGAVVAIQIAALLGIVLMGKKPPSEGAVVLVDARFELFVALAAAGVAATALGLMLSAIAKSYDQLLPLLVVSIMAQIVFTGGLIPVTGRILLEQLSWLWPARWGFAATASTVDLSRVAPLAPTGEQLWTHDIKWWCFSLGMLTLQTAVFMIVTRWRLRMRCR